MKLDGIGIKGKLFESVIGDIADHVVERVCEEYSDEVLERVMNVDTFKHKLQADSDFRNIVESHVNETIQDILNDSLFDFDVEYGIRDDIMADKNHWLAEHIAELDRVQQEQEHEEELQYEVEREQSLAQALALLEKRGLKVTQQDNELAKAMRIAQAAGFKVEA